MYIGELIRQEIEKQERTVTWFARKLCCNRQNVYDIFKRNTIDTELLLRISIILHTDFFEWYSHEYTNRIINDDV
mgnify:CR=1 FL=1